jgi:signal transduction histidine kinase
MTKFFLRIFHFIKQYPGILYSLFLILILPLILYYNTFLAAKSFQENVDYNLQTKALIIENILGTFFSDSFDKPTALQEKIEEITKENPEIEGLRVAVEEKGGEFRILASQNPYEIEAKVREPSFALSFSQEQTIANLTSRNGERLWNVIKPIYDKEGNKVGLVSMALSLKEADVLITRAIFRSYIIVILAILLSLFLIFQHTRLFGYVSLTKKLRELDRMKDNFIRMATHELQSPIINIRGYLEALEEEIGSSLTEEQKELFRRAKVSAKNLSDLIYDILEISRIEQGRLDFTLQKVSPQKVIAEIVQDLKMKASQKNLNLLLELEDGSYFINVNPNRFRQILTNLIENAIKYTFKGEISVRSKTDKNKKRYIIEVEDTGIGISAQDQPRLFERFFRIKTKETADIPGTGLGLWITKQLTEKMGGKIFVESMKGIGTKFTVIFPLAKS